MNKMGENSTFNLLLFHAYSCSKERFETGLQLSNFFSDYLRLVSANFLDREVQIILSAHIHKRVDGQSTSEVFVWE